MSVDVAIDLCRSATVVSLMIAAPVLACAVIVGLVISILQAVTQLQDQTLSFVPKIIAMGAVMVYVLPWAISRMTAYSIDLFKSVPMSFGP
ncbi:MAG: flagellar biosynthetic protein FliQ [Planctomycetaceae bacterium]|nr:flagellar biosynthetic protein FliQ [Planctomycetaceae bacterium]